MKSELIFNTKSFARFWLFFGFLTLSNFAMAGIDGLEGTKGALDLIIDWTIYLTVTGFSLVIIFKLWQIYLGNRELSEIVFPVVIVSLVIGAKLFAPLIVAAMGYSS